MHKTWYTNILGVIFIWCVYDVYLANNIFCRIWVWGVQHFLWVISDDHSQRTPPTIAFNVNLQILYFDWIHHILNNGYKLYILFKITLYTIFDNVSVEGRFYKIPLD